jgi:hypothetical protein
MEEENVFEWAQGGILHQTFDINKWVASLQVVEDFPPRQGTGL